MRPFSILRNKRIYSLHDDAAGLRQSGRRGRGRRVAQRPLHRCRIRLESGLRSVNRSKKRA